MSEKYAVWVTLRPQSDRCCRGEAKVHILDFQTTWSEFQKESQTATKWGEAELKYSILKPDSQSSRSPVRLYEAKPSYTLS